MAASVSSTHALSEMNEQAAPAATGGKKRLSVERIYQRKTQLEHVLLRPDSYVGSVEETTQPMWVWDEEKEAIVQRQVTFVPGLYKIFDEILVNAADNKQRDHRMNALKITIDPENNVISVWNNGRGIPVEMHSVEKMYVPELIFGTLLTSSNYDDDEKKVTGGRNGYGAKLCNIFSTEFSVQTSCSQSKKMFKQTWKNNMGSAGKVSITDSTQDYTKVTFKPDLAKFKMTHLTADMVSLMTRRAYDMAGCTKGVSVYFNGKKLPIKTFKDYVQLYLKGQEGGAEEEEGPRKVVHEVVNQRWEVCVTPSDNGFQQSSFVNSIATTKGGTHVNMIVDQLVPKLLEAAKKKNKGGMELRPFHIKGHLWVFVNCLVENPTFDSQTKENMTLKARSFGSKGELSDKFIKQVLTCGVMERVLTWARAKSQSQLNKKQHGSKNSKLRGIPKLDDANSAGCKNSFDCTLIVTEGDSAKALAVSGLGVVGRDHYGVFPLRGKLLNVREATHNQIINNEEIKSLIRILGLQYGKKYTTQSDLNGLRYGRIMIMADQDQDGSHIKGLVINFIHHNWPGLLKQGFIVQFITPIVKVTKGQQQKAFFSLPEFEAWQATTDNSHTWKVKYYKGLGTSTSKEAKEYFSDMDRHRIPFQYAGQEDDQAITLAFSKKHIDDRKVWLTSWLQHRKEQREQGLQESFLYGGQQQSSISYSDFINKELILFSNMDNERSIASVVDGLKPGQRKVMFTCFKRNDKREVKVAQLAGSVAEHSAYHHGEQSLMMTIVNLAQNYVGSNNINLLLPLGQFGTRLHGGKDAASSRYIFTMLSPLARRLFIPSDENLLVFQKDDNIRIEPEWYCPIIPTVLINGCEGIGTGYSTTVPNYNPREIVANIKRLMSGLEPIPMQPWYKGFTGTIAHTEPQRYLMYGSVARLDQTTIEITELPVRTWTQSYKENVLEPMLHGSEKVQPSITDYKEYHTDTTVKFVVTVPQAKMAEAEEKGFHKRFKLESSLSTSNLVLFNKDGCLHKYSDELEILSEFYSVRLDMYHRRKQWIEGQLTAESDRLNSQARFIMEKIEGKIVIENKKKAEMVEQLKTRGYPSDPLKAWKQQSMTDQEEEQDSDEQAEEPSDAKAPDYSYLLSMQLLSLTREEKEKLLKNRDKKAEELEILKEKTPKMLWMEDIDAFMEELDRVEEEERQELAAGATIAVKKKKGKQHTGGRQAKLTASGSLSTTNSMASTKPSAFAELIPPAIPAFCAEKPKKATRVKKDKVDPSQKKMDQFTTAAAKPEAPVEEEEPVSLTERLKKKGIVSPLAQPSVPRRPAKRKATDPVIDIASSGEEDSDGHVSSSPPPPRETHQRRAAATSAVIQDDIPQYDDDEIMSDGASSDDEFCPGGVGGSSDDDFRPAPKKGRTKPPPPTQRESASPSPPAAVASKPTAGTKRPAAPAGNKQKAAKLTVAKKPAQKTASKKEASQKTASKKETSQKTASKKEPAQKTGTKKTLTKIPAVSKASKKQTKAITDFFAEDSDEDDEETVAKKTTKKPAAKSAAAKKPAKPVALSSDDDDDEVTMPTKKPATKSAAAKKPAKTVALSSDDDDDEVTMPTKKPATKSTAAKKPAKPVALSSDDDDDEVTMPTKKPAAKSTAAKKPAAKAVALSSDDDAEEAAGPSGAAAPRGGGRVRRAMKRVKYAFSESEEDDDTRYDPGNSSGDEMD